MSGKFYNVTEEQVRLEVRNQLAARTDIAGLTTQIARDIGHDQARKQRILQDSPHLAYSMDAEELAKMSAGELARYELKQLGINVSDNSDPVEVRDAFHAGRMHERQGAPSGRSTASMDSAGSDVLSRYIRGET
jgi:hypothetical protein